MADNINNYKSVITMDPADYDWDVIKDGYQEESKEEKEMSTITKNNESVNAKVNENKEEITMTKALNMNAYMAQIQAELENKTGESFKQDAPAPKKYAQKERLGLNYEVIKSIEYSTIKYAGKEDEGKAPRFVRIYKVTLADESVPPIIISNPIFMYEGDNRVEDVDIYDAVVNGAGNKGFYFTVDPKAIDKKAEELTPEDLIPHEVKDNQRIWKPAKQELIALAKQMEVSELEFDADGFVKIPKDFKAAIYVYEDVVKDKIVKQVKGEVKKFQTIEYFYNASFVKPEDVHNMKYGRAFTASEDSTRRAELRELPGVVRYLESC